MIVFSTRDTESFQFYFDTINNEHCTWSLQQNNFYRWGPDAAGW